MSDDDEACCPEYEPNTSHYHCAYCGCLCSMMGHLEEHGQLRCPPEDERPAWAAALVDEEALADLKERYPDGD